MKKLAIIFFIGIIIIVGISYMYLNYKFQYNESKKANNQFESYYNQEIYGSELATIMNKAIDKNESNQVTKDNKGKYINNDENSINIDIKMLDDDKTHFMEEFYMNGMQNFVKYYNPIKFKCTKIEYHKSTNNIKYMMFEQITK